MEALAVLAVQCTLSVLVFYLATKWYVIPRINKETIFDVLAFLLLINVFRYLPLSLFMPGQVSEAFPLYLKKIVAYGDFLSGMIALTAWILLHSNKKGALALTWIFSVISIVDLIGVLILAIIEKVYSLPLGTNYFTISVYVPMLIVILKILTRKKFKLIRR